MKKAQESPEAQEALKTLKTAVRLNSAFIEGGAARVKKIAEILATQQSIGGESFDVFYKQLSNTVGLEAQVKAIILGMADNAKRLMEHTLNTIRERQVGRKIKEALRKPRPSPIAEEGVLAGLPRSTSERMLDEDSENGRFFWD